MLISKETKSFIKMVVFMAVETHAKMKIARLRREREDIDAKIEGIQEFGECVGSVSRHFMDEYFKHKSATRSQEERVH